MSTVYVYNLTTDERHVYTDITPEQAVIAAYAQSLRDWNTWDYARKYAHLVTEGAASVACGDFAAMKGE